ncbi:MAG: hypothetical protein ACO1TE_18805 [Prosthecobacter sp.]
MLKEVTVIRMKKMVKIRVLPALVIGLLLCAAGLLWPTLGKRRQFTVAVNIWPGVEGIFPARQAATFKDTPVSFVEFSWSAAVMGAFQKRVVDAAVVSLDELLRLEAGDAQPQAMLVLGVSKGSDAILARPGIEGVAGLRGRRVGVELHSAGEYLLMNSLRRHRLSLGDIVIVPLNLAETESAYLERDLDAVVTADPWRARLVDKGAVLLDDSSDMGLEMSRVLVVRRGMEQEFHDETRRLIAACLEHASGKGASWEADGLAAVLRREGLTGAQWKSALSVIHTPGAEENIRLLEGELAEVLRLMAARMRADGSLARDVEIAPLLNAAFVKEVL